MSSAPLEVFISTANEQPHLADEHYQWLNTVWFPPFIHSWQLHGLQVTGMSKSGSCGCDVKWTSFKLAS